MDKKRVNKSEKNEHDKHDIELVIACEKAAKAFNPSEKALNLIAEFV